VVDTTFTLDRGYAVWGAVITVAAGFVWYFLWKLMEKRRGVDVGMQFKEIPVE
jgi:hypothetical protein